MLWSDAIHTEPTGTVARFEEFRRYRRQAYAGRVVRLDGESQECGALDISEGGIGILSCNLMEPGQVVHLAFFGQSMSVRGMVTHVRPTTAGDWRVGICFLQDEPELVEVALAAS